MVCESGCCKQTVVNDASNEVVNATGRGSEG